jgi:predicted permease
LAIATALSLHFLNAKVWLPPFAIQSVHSLGAAAIPMGLLLTGATFADQMGSLSSDRPWSTDTGSIILRLAVLPVLMLLIARWVPCPVELRRVILVQAAMPCAVIPVLLSRHFGGQPGLAMRIVLVTSALGLFTIPFWLQKGAQWIPGISR